MNIYSYLNSLKLFVAKLIESVIQSKWLWAHSKAILACNSNVDHTVIWHLFISFNNLIMVIIFLCICHSIFNLNIPDYTANISVHGLCNEQFIRRSYIDLILFYILQNLKTVIVWSVDYKHLYWILYILSRNFHYLLL